MVTYTFNSTTCNSHVLNSSPREVETRRDMAGLRVEYKVGKGRRWGLEIESEDAIRGCCLRRRFEDRIAPLVCSRGKRPL